MDIVAELTDELVDSLAFNMVDGLKKLNLIESTGCLESRTTKEIVQLVKEKKTMAHFTSIRNSKKPKQRVLFTIFRTKFKQVSKIRYISGILSARNEQLHDNSKTYLQNLHDGQDTEGELEFGLNRACSMISNLLHDFEQLK